MTRILSANDTNNSFIFITVHLQLKEKVSGNEFIFVSFVCKIRVIRGCFLLRLKVAYYRIRHLCG